MIILSQTLSRYDYGFRANESRKKNKDVNYLCYQVVQKGNGNGSGMGSETIHCCDSLHVLER